MSQYFLPEESIRYGVGDDPRTVIATVARRYCGENPPRPFVFHAWPETTLRQGSDGRYVLDLASHFPQAAHGTWGYAFGQIWAAADAEAEFAINCHGPVRVMVNGELAFKPDIVEEVNRTILRNFRFALRRGWNAVLVACRRTASGFGCVMGAPEPKWQIYDFFAPFAGRRGQAGWVYALGTERDVFAGKLPRPDQDEAETGLQWLPRQTYDSAQASAGLLSRLFGGASGFAYGWTGLPACGLDVTARRITGYSAQPVRFLADGQAIVQTQAGDFAFDLPRDARNLVAEFSLSHGGGEFRISLADDGRPVSFRQAVQVQGTDETWIFLGPFAAQKDGAAGTLCDLSRVHDDRGTARYWRIDRPDTRLRPYLECAQYGRWSYPLGVTMYGLLQAGRVLDDPVLRDYVHGHIGQCTRFHDYACWDAKDAGYPVINNQLVELNMLDDCGSFGSAMLESRLDTGDEASRHLADTIAHHMRHRQERQPDGAFYRECKGNFHENTMWADDLYMSTPFMVRYAALSGDASWLDDAARQFRLFRSYLYIPELRLMSHVYDFKYGTKTGVPWGRGNGWVLFSLSELLAVLPAGHPARPELVAFFNDFARGILAVQGESGLWHQVLTEPEAYAETSCTAMFTYGLSRSLRHGWLDPALRPAAEAAIARAWNGLVTESIDHRGNVYGVCRGSRFSYTKEYYMEELGWILNDTHGIGIVLLAGIEVAKLQEAAATGIGTATGRKA